MRVWGGLAVMLSLCACEPSPRAGSDGDATAAAYDYRYAYRLPTDRIKAVQDSHAAGCDRLGAARCRVTALRYSVAKDRVSAALTLTLDPEIARGFGQAATRTVLGAHGMLIDTDIAAIGTHADPALAQLRAALAASDIAARAGDTNAAAKAARLRTVLATIADVDPAAASSLATAPVILTYTSGTPTGESGLAAAGNAFVDSLGRLAVLLGGIGPWLLLLVGGALVLRRFVQPTDTHEEPRLPFAMPRPDPEDRGNVIRRWFHREPENID